MKIPLLLLFMIIPFIIVSEQFVMKKKKQSESYHLQKDRLIECHAEIAQQTNALIQHAARMQQESHALLKNVSEGKSVQALPKELEKAEKKLATVKRYCQELGDI